MKTSFVKTSKVIETHIVDAETGEVLNSEVKELKFLANTKDSFFLAYTSLLGVLRQLTLPEIKLYCYLLESYNIGSKMCFYRGMKELMSAETGMAVKTITNSIGGLSEKKLIYPIQRGIYKLNPRYAFKGEGGSKERNNALKFTIEVECPNC